MDGLKPIIEFDGQNFGGFAREQLREVSQAGSDFYDKGFRSSAGTGGNFSQNSLIDEEILAHGFLQSQPRFDKEP